MYKSNLIQSRERLHPIQYVSTFGACECNVKGTPRISFIPLFALGVLDGDGLCPSVVK